MYARQDHVGTVHSSTCTEITLNTSRRRQLYLALNFAKFVKNGKFVRVVKSVTKRYSYVDNVMISTSIVDDAVEAPIIAP